MPLTWPKCRKLVQRAEYTACYDRGERYYTRSFVVFALGGNRPLLGRLGLAVTRKCGNAVQRNRIKRVLREFFRLHQHDMPAMDIVVTPKRRLRADMLDLALAKSELAPLLAQLRRSFPPRAADAAPGSCDTACHMPEIRSGTGGETSGRSNPEGGTA